MAGYALPPQARSTFRDLGLDGEPDLVEGDLRDFEQLLDALRRFEPEVVLHLAAQALVSEGYRDPVGTFNVNILGTVHLLEAVRRTPSVRAVVVVTSDKCYEDQGWHWSYRENSPLGGRDPYSASKAACELVTRAYRDSFLADSGVQVATARAGNVIGGGDWSRHRLIPDLVRALETGEPITLRNPQAVRPWQFVLEPLAGYLILAERLLGPQAAEAASTWNFAPSESEARTVAEVIQCFGEFWGQMPKMNRPQEPLMPEVSYLKLDASLARAKLGWRSRLNLDQALDWTAQGYLNILQGKGLRVVASQQIARYHELP